MAAAAVASVGKRVARAMATDKQLGRMIFFPNLPLKLQLPSSLDNIKEVSLRTIPSATKIEIKRILELVYGLEVEKVMTLNMEGKKKFDRKKHFFYRRPNYKKAYVVLKNPISIPRSLFPLNTMRQYGEEEDTGKQDK